MPYLVVLFKTSAIPSISSQVSFHAAAKYAVAKYFIQLVQYTIYNNVQAE